MQQLEPIHTPLISGLPDDIALFCLARVPRRYHTLLKCVSRRWKELVCSEEWYSYRRKHNLEETWIYALCRDRINQICCYVLDPNSSKRCWRRIRDIPSQCTKRKGMSFEALGNKIYLLGGCGWFQDATDEVYCYDTSKNSWDKVAAMSTASFDSYSVVDLVVSKRVCELFALVLLFGVSTWCYFACEALNEKIYAIGGVGSNSSDPLSWDTYDPRTNSWTSYSDLNVVPDIEESVVMDGKIYIRCGASSTIPPHVYSVVYEPSNGTWQHADNDMVSGWRGPSIVVNDVLYVLDETSGTRLMMWQKESKDWVALGRLSPLLTRPPCRLAVVGNCIIVIGKGLSTVVIDVGEARNMGGVVVSSSIPKLASDDDVISCKTMSL
ncbi:hypothetical protein IFM89_037697 [Coptis chinensis]|uniref:F-box domain-containing protein n=1 Tax=Coptis chinensis TaxID=261450 RepID=A0A835M8G4_9MAGN|nr:hypothetical protein IFM89_037697 [Coptis chinensis]